MPFIFHAEKRSIFDRRVDADKDAQVELGYYDQCSQLEQRKNMVSISTSICKEHPFRGYRQPKDGKIVVYLRRENGGQDVSSIERGTSVKAKVYRGSTVGMRKGDNQLNKNGLQITVDKYSSDNQCKQEQQQLRQLVVRKNYQTSNFRKPFNQPNERLVYSHIDTPGPGSYNPSAVQKPQSPTSSIYPTVQKTIPLPVCGDNQLLEYMKSVEKRVEIKRKEKKLGIQCSYKHQSSPCFRSSVLKKGKKSSGLLSVLLSNKINDGKKREENQSETTCESRVAGGDCQDKEYYDGDEEYVKLESTAPGPCSYDPKMSSPSARLTKKSRVFITGQQKFASTGKSLASPGPGAYLSSSGFGQDYSQNQIKLPNKFDTDEKNKPCVFSSSIARELDFGQGERGKQELYYSPKTSLVDELRQKEKKSTLSNQFYFGSSLERFGKDVIDESDPYRYCFAKLKEKKGGVVMCRQKRGVFEERENVPGPLEYKSDLHTIEKQVQNTISKQVLQQKYLSQTVGLRDKKANMVRDIIEESRNCIDIKNTEQEYEGLNVDKYKEYLMRKKRAERKGVSFGCGSKAVIERGFKPKKELDRYYETEPSWEKGTFNKLYGYQVYEQ